MIPSGCGNFFIVAHIKFSSNLWVADEALNVCLHWSSDFPNWHDYLIHLSEEVRFAFMITQLFQVRKPVVTCVWQVTLVSFITVHLVA